MTLLVVSRLVGDGPPASSLSLPRGPAAGGEGRVKWRDLSSEELQSKMSAPSEPRLGVGGGPDVP